MTKPFARCFLLDVPRKHRLAVSVDQMADGFDFLLACIGNIEWQMFHRVWRKIKKNPVSSLSTIFFSLSSTPCHYDFYSFLLTLVIPNTLRQNRKRHILYPQEAPHCYLSALIVLSCSVWLCVAAWKKWNIIYIVFLCEMKLLQLLFYF